MRYGVTLPLLDPQTMIGLAREAEEAGWDGVFVWDGIWGLNVWVILAAIATRTERIRFGTMLTPLSRRRPWSVASEVVTLDHLSHGRVILPVGLGAVGEEHQHDWFAQVGEETDRKTRAKMLDESLDIIDGLWRGQPFSYNGEHYHLREVEFSPVPVQQPRVPIWVVGAWPRMKSMRRALRCDGVLPVKMGADGKMSEMTPDDLRAMKAHADENRTLTSPFDIVMENGTPGDNPEQAAAIVRPLAEAGLTWWLESVWAVRDEQGEIADMATTEHIRARVKQGPPRIA